LLERLDKIKAERQRRQQPSQPDRRDVIAHHVMRMVVIAFGLYVVYAALRCTWEPSCPIYPILRVLS
jgi:hypothetical protein